MDDKTGTDSKSLSGHSGPVYATSFTPDRNMMISSSEDGTSKEELLFHTAFRIVINVL